MRAVDLIRPSHEPKAFQQDNRCVVSSIASLADIFIHLPLIAEIVNDTRRRETESATSWPCSMPGIARI